MPNYTPQNPCLARFARMAFQTAALLGVPLLLFGCSTTASRSGRLEHQFDPLPQAEVEQTDLTPVTARSIEDLLRDAEEALAAANEAQERGDNEAALRYYTLMLELLIDADLDPAVFYALREQFGGILDATSQHARRYESPSLEGLAEELAGAYGAIEMPNPLPDRVLAEVKAIQKGYPKNFQTGLDRSQRYLPFIKEELRKEGMPEELAYLPMVESLFTPKIVSRAGAGGMWQFMRSTGLRYRLRIDSHVDERYNWQSSTRAAINYLKDLHAYFGGSWPLAISAYNMGEFGLERAVAANGGERNFWRLIETPPASNRIRLETKNYLPRFLATLIVASDPGKYGFTIHEQIPDNTVRVPVSGMYALDELDKALGLPSGTLARLNPDLLQEMTPPAANQGGSATPYAVAVPAEHRDNLLAALKTVPQLKYGGKSHKVRRGETISQIAKRYGVSEKELMRINSIKHARNLQVGQALRLPGYSAARGGDTPETPSPARNADGTYVVKPGDTLFDIASAHGVSVEELQRWNGLRGQARIFAQDKLHIAEPGSAAAPEPAAAPPAEKQYYTVKAGDFPGKIAKNCGISLADLLKLNNLTAKSTIRVGDKLVVGAGGGGGSGNVATAKADVEPAKAETPAKAEASAASYTVANGDTLGKIAAKQGVSTKDLMAWNGLTAKSVLQVGQKLTLKSGGDAPAEPEQTVHVVAKGQNPTTIARRYEVDVNDLYKWNKWPTRHVLQVGDKVVIYKN